MREAVIVSTARTPIAKAFRGAFNNLSGPKMAAHAMRAAVARAGLEGYEVEDVTLGCALTQGTTGVNIARHAAQAAGLPDSVAGATVDRQCASGLSAISIAANQVVNEGLSVALAGGLDSISLVQNAKWNGYRYKDPAVPSDYYLSMLETAETVANRYNISREAQDKYALESQKRTAAAQQLGRFKAEIVQVEAVQIVTDKISGAISEVSVTLETDQCNRPQTTLEDLQSLKPVLGEGTSITAGNASQLSDGASACVVMERSEAIRRRLNPLGIYRGMAVAGCAPDEMGIGPVIAIPRLLERHGLSVDDIGIWEINEAFAAQLLYCRHRLGIPSERLNVSGGAISIGHPYGMSGARMAGHALIEGARIGAKYAVVSMCIGGGQGAAALFEIGK